MRYFAYFVQREELFSEHAIFFATNLAFHSALWYTDRTNTSLEVLYNGCNFHLLYLQALEKRTLKGRDHLLAAAMADS